MNVEIGTLSSSSLLFVKLTFVGEKKKKEMKKKEKKKTQLFSIQLIMAKNAP